MKLRNVRYLGLIYLVEYAAHAIKNTNKLPSEAKTRIFNSIRKIKEDLYEHAKKLKTSAKSPLCSLIAGEC